MFYTKYSNVVKVNWSAIINFNMLDIWQTVPDS